MNELFQEEGSSIFCFKKGDIIIRLKPIEVTKTIHNENLGVTTEIKTGSDSSFRTPLEFLCVKNNLIYLRSIKEDSFYKKKTIHTAYLEEYSENWGLFEVPEGLTLDDCIK